MGKPLARKRSLLRMLNGTERSGKGRVHGRNFVKNGRRRCIYNISDGGVAMFHGLGEFGSRCRGSAR